MDNTTILRSQTDQSQNQVRNNAAKISELFIIIVFQIRDKWERIFDSHEKKVKPVIGATILKTARD